MFSLVALLALGAALGAQGQVTATAPQAEQPQYQQRLDLYGGAQYMHFNPGTGRGDQVAANNLMGWTGGATLWLKPVWGIEASARGAYGTMTVPPNTWGVPAHPKMSEHLALFGPDFRLIRKPRLTAGIHVLIGAAYGAFSANFPHLVQPQQVDIYNDKLAFGYVFGTPVDFNLSPRMSVRFVPDWQATHYGFSQQNEFAGSIGIVYKFGTLGGR